MTELKRIQEAIQEYIQKGDVLAFDDVADDNQFAAERLQIYRNSYFLRVIERLESDYPKLALHLGQVVFGQLAHDYMLAVPSTHYSIHEIGRKLPEFMAAHSKYPPAWSALARMEAALSFVLEVAKEPPLTLSTLSTLSSNAWAIYRFQLIKAHRIILCHLDMATYFNLHMTEAMPMMIWQRQDKACYQLLSENDAHLMNYFNQGLDFTEVCEKMSQHLSQEQGISFIFQRIQYWLNQEIFSDHQME